ncbi:MAG: type II toxin-antitoxin system VapC family toxin [Burkholderiales bacterium]|nr:MAG: type II toxin-antitoxin system VapC family toxin [Burkholderiales bacterium]
MILLDTDTFSFLARGVPSVVQACSRIDAHDLKLSVISQGEIIHGMHHYKLSALRQTSIMSLMESFEVLPITTAVATVYEEIKANLTKLGQHIGPNDFWIAAHALSLGATLVTNNVREFKRIKGLKVENWLQ